MKILTAQQTREADAYTIANEPISSTDLMERAATKCFDWIIKNYNAETEFAIFCGVGNNGGDGLVVARLLVQANYKVSVFVVDFSKNYSPDFKINLEKLPKECGEVNYLKSDSFKFILKPNIVVVDAIFGSGLNKPIDGFVSTIIQQINQHEVVAIDLPSGLFAEDNRVNDFESIVKAKFTLTFQQPKLAMLFPQNYLFVGEWIVLPIGLNQEFIEFLPSNYFLITILDAKRILIKRTKFSHKGTFGHALLIAGSKGKMGAAILSAKACLRAGVGLLTVHIPAKGLEIMQTALPEAMCRTSDENDFIADVPELSAYNAIGIGPGLGMEKQTQNAFKLLIQNANFPLVIDADALNILSENKTWLAFLPQESILTPHPKEFERLVGKWDSDEERLEMQRQFAIKHQIIVVLKGANTAIALSNGDVYFNSTGNAGMATAGSGDVLTGIITSLLAQRYLPSEAAILGVYLHGLAGDVAKENLTEYAMIATDIIDALPKAYGWIN
jgi:NAD(P)H-hydrate epimerase